MSETAERQPTLLLVEDDEQVRRLVRGLLGGRNLNIVEAGTGREGLSAARDAGHVDVLVTDMLLPELSGYDLAAELREQFPEMRIIMMTGYIEGEIVQRGVNELQATFLDKPFDPDELRRMVDSALTAQR